mmetsp:Transcript_33064/g.95762  ORF Transcript_33064/g.95762 Transcript_33064/m.95762 type:complete len:242 (+) Transcript_33064:205-930(+)
MGGASSLELRCQRAKTKMRQVPMLLLLAAAAAATVRPSEVCVHVGQARVAGGEEFDELLVRIGCRDCFLEKALEGQFVSQFQHGLAVEAIVLDALPGLLKVHFAWGQPHKVPQAAPGSVGHPEEWVICGGEWGGKLCHVARVADELEEPFPEQVVVFLGGTLQVQHGLARAVLRDVKEIHGVRLAGKHGGDPSHAEKEVAVHGVGGGVDSGTAAGARVEGLTLGVTFHVATKLHCAPHGVC